VRREEVHQGLTKTCLGLSTAGLIPNFAPSSMSLRCLHALVCEAYATLHLI
jgi:hypothetical protein